MQKLKVQPLASERIPQCFPLAHLAAPNLTVSQWQDFASGHLKASPAKQGGILVAEQNGGCILGFLVYQIDLDPLHGRTLLVKNLIAQGYFAQGRRQVESVLLQAAESLARGTDCRAVHIMMPLHGKDDQDPELAAKLEARGHIKTGITYCKPLAAH